VATGLLLLRIIIVIIIIIIITFDRIDTIFVAYMSATVTVTASVEEEASKLSVTPPSLPSALRVESSVSTSSWDDVVTLDLQPNNNNNNNKDNHETHHRHNKIDDNSNVFIVDDSSTLSPLLETFLRIPSVAIKRWSSPSEVVSHDHVPKITIKEPPSTSTNEPNEAPTNDVTIALHSNASSSGSLTHGLNHTLHHQPGRVNSSTHHLRTNSITESETSSNRHSKEVPVGLPPTPFHSIHKRTASTGFNKKGAIRSLLKATWTQLGTDFLRRDIKSEIKQREDVAAAAGKIIKHIVFIRHGESTGFLARCIVPTYYRSNWVIRPQQMKHSIKKGRNHLYLTLL